MKLLAFSVHLCTFEMPWSSSAARGRSFLVRLTDTYYKSVFGDLTVVVFASGLSNWIPSDSIFEA